MGKNFEKSEEYNEFEPIRYQYTSIKMRTNVELGLFV